MFCSDCLKVKTCKKVCKELQECMTKEGIYSPDYIRPRVTGGGSWREIPVGNASDLEKLANKRAFTLRYGKKFYKERAND